MFRKLRDLVLAGVVGGLLVLGGAALADIPDSRPSSPDSTHTIYGCYYPAGGTSSLRQFQILDKSLGNCPTGYAEVRFVPSALP